MAFVDLIKAFDIEDYLSERGKLRRSGPTNHNMPVCPLCGNSKGDKFYINTSGGEHNGRWNSYCCHDSGGLVKLVQYLEECSEPEAIAFIQRRVDGNEDIIPLVENTKDKPPAPAGLSVGTVVHAELPQPIFPATSSIPCVVRGQQLTLEHRGVTDYIIARHRLHVTGQSTWYQGKRRYDLDNRLIIPVFDKTGAVLLSWQARDLGGLASRRYIFPGGDRSSETLYGCYEHTSSTILIVEGVFHKWAWDEFGHRTNMPAVARCSVASFGKKLTFAQEELLMSNPGIERVIFGWDLDAAPEVSKIAERLNGRKQVWIMKPSPDGRDHDELSINERYSLFMHNTVPYTRELAIQMKVDLARSR